MIRTSMILTLALVCAAQAQKANHEAAEDKARTVPGGPSKGVKACHDDIERWCKGIAPGDGRIGTCLKANKKKLSKKCARWAAHGGKVHSDSAFLEIDKELATPKAPVK